MELTSQKLRKIAPELDPLRLGTGWKLEDLSKPQIMIESTFGDSHPGSGHLSENSQLHGSSCCLHGSDSSWLYLHAILQCYRR